MTIIFFMFIYPLAYLKGEITSAHSLQYKLHIQVEKLQHDPSAH